MLEKYQRDTLGKVGLAFSQPALGPPINRLTLFLFSTNISHTYNAYNLNANIYC